MRVDPLDAVQRGALLSRHDPQQVSQRLQVGAVDAQAVAGLARFAQDARELVGVDALQEDGVGREAVFRERVNELCQLAISSRTTASLTLSCWWSINRPQGRSARPKPSDSRVRRS